MVRRKKTKTYSVVIPIAGEMSCTVTVPADADEDDIFEAAIDKHNGHPDKCELTWEFHQEIASGNVLNASTNEWEYTEEK